MSQIKGNFKSRGFVNENGVVGFEYWEALIARNDDPDRNWIFFGIILFNPIKRNVLLLVKILLPTDD